MGTSHKTYDEGSLGKIPQSTIFCFIYLTLNLVSGF